MARPPTYDYSGNNHNFSLLNGAQYLNNYQSVKFDGVNDYIRTVSGQSSPAWNASTSWTTMIWFKPTALPTGFFGTMYLDDFDYGNDTGLQIALLNFSGTNARSTVFTGSTTQDGGAAMNYTLGQWNYIIVHFNGTRLVQIGNGVVTANNTRTGKASATNSTYNFTQSGGEGTGTSNQYTGEIGEVRRFFRNYTQTDIEDFINNRTISDKTNLVLWWSMENLTTNTVTANFSTPVFNLTPNFYGVNTHGVWGNSYSFIDTNHDGTLDTASNYQYHRDAFNNASIFYLRDDGWLEIVSGGVNSFYNNTLTNTKNIQARRDRVAWANANNIKLLVIMGYMPTWLSDNASTCSSNHERCAPTSYTTWGQLNVNYLSAIGCDVYVGTCEVEVWNEPDLSTFLQPDGTCADRIDTYNKLYNASYKAIKASNMSSIPVYGPSVSDSASNSFPTVCGYQLMRSWLRNATIMSYGIDGISYHDYFNPTSSTETFASRAAFVESGITQHLQNTSWTNLTRIKSEWGTHLETIQVNNVTGQKYELTAYYNFMLNNYGNNSINIFYQHAEDCAYGNWACSDQYPLRFQWISEPLLDNVNYTAYNLTRQITFSHPAGATIVNTTYTSNVTVTCTNNPTNYACTVLNNKPNPDEVTITLNGVTGTTVNQYGVATTYTLNSNSFQYNLTPYGAESFYIQKQSITFATTSPNTPWSVAEPNNQVFTYSLTNPDSLTTTSVWNFNGTTRIDCANLTTCTFTGNYTSSGLYNISVNVTAETNSIYYSWAFTVNNTDVTPPTVTVVSPVAGTYTTSTLLINFNATDTESNISALWFNNGTANVTYTGPVNLTLADGTYNLGFYANDTSNNIGLTTVLVTINTVPPTCEDLGERYGVLMRIFLILIVVLLAFFMYQLFGSMDLEVQSILLVAGIITCVVIASVTILPLVTNYCLT